jgi:hypothetical protein
MPGTILEIDIARTSEEARARSHETRRCLMVLSAGIATSRQTTSKRCMIGYVVYVSFLRSHTTANRLNMLVSEDELKAGSIVRHALSKGFRGSTYDLTIGSLICPDGKAVSEYVIPPQGMVKVISRERVAMPLDRIGYVLVKTALCNKGILALNTGIVDSGFEGKLTSTLINFGKNEQYLSTQTAFSRLTVHRLDSPSTTETVKVSDIAVGTTAKEQVLSYLSASFLDISSTIEKASKSAFDRYRNTMLWAAPAVAIVISVITVGANYGNNWVAEKSYFATQDVAKANAEGELVRRISALEAQNASQQAMLQKLMMKLEARTDLPGARTPTAGH